MWSGNFREGKKQTEQAEKQKRKNTWQAKIASILIFKIHNLKEMHSEQERKHKDERAESQIGSKTNK